MYTRSSLPLLIYKYIIGTISFPVTVLHLSGYSPSSPTDLTVTLSQHHQRFEGVRLQHGRQSTSRDLLLGLESIRLKYFAMSERPFTSFIHEDTRRNAAKHFASQSVYNWSSILMGTFTQRNCSMHPSVAVQQYLKSRGTKPYPDLEED